MIDLKTSLFDARQGSLTAWMVCMVASLFFFYEFIQLNMFNSINQELTNAFSLSAVQLGLLSSSYFLADVIFLIPAGMILDRFSTRGIILTALVLCVGGTFMFSQATQFWMAAISHFMSGIGNAFAFLGGVRLASRWFHSRQLALVVGVMVTIGMLGGVVAQAPLTYLVSAVGWRTAMEYNAILGMIIFLLILMLVRDYPREKGLQHLLEQKKLKELGVVRSFIVALSNPQNWLAGIYISLLNLSIFIMGALWGTTYLVQVRHVTKSQASIIASMIFFGTIIGAPLIGWFSDRLNRRRFPMILFAILSLLVAVLLMTSQVLTNNALALLFFLLGFFTSAQVLGYPVITESNHPAVTSTSVALAAVLIMGGGALFQLLFCTVLESQWIPLYIQNIPQYSAQDFNRALLILPIAFIVSFISALLLREPTDYHVVIRTKEIK